jgi:hypothetical protein
MYNSKIRKQKLNVFIITYSRSVLHNILCDIYSHMTNQVQSHTWQHFYMGLGDKEMEFLQRVNHTLYRIDMSEIYFFKLYKTE